MILSLFHPLASGFIVNMVPTKRPALRYQDTVLLGEKPLSQISETLRNNHSTLTHMKKFIYLLLLVLTSAITVHAQNFDHSPIRKGCEIEEYLQFKLCYSEQHEQPQWVSYFLTQQELALQTRNEPSRFITDTNISSGSATHDDFTNTGYDRGHISRAMYNKASQDTYNQSYFMSNVSPQYGAGFNRAGGDWFALEELEIDIAYGLDSIYSISGPVFKDNIEVIGDDNAITVPGYFFKAFLSPDKKEAIGFVLKHDKQDLPNLWDAAMSIDEL